MSPRFTCLFLLFSLGNDTEKMQSISNSYIAATATVPFFSLLTILSIIMIIIIISKFCCCLHHKRSSEPNIVKPIQNAFDHPRNSMNLHSPLKNLLNGKS